MYIGVFVKITSVTSESYYSGIFLPDLESVKKALYAYDQGFAPSSNATRRELASAGGGTTLMMLDMVQSHGNMFIDKLFGRIEATLTEQSVFDQSFDYDGAGRYLKTSVTVNKLPDGYLLSLYAAYVGNKPEGELAEHLGATRGLIWSKVDLTIDSAKKDMFIIDFQPIMDTLDGTVFGDKSATEIASAIAAGWKEDWSNITQQGGFIELFNDGTFAATLRLDNITVGSYYEQPYTSDGSVVTGPLHKGWNRDESGFEKPVVTINIRQVADTRYPLIDLDGQQQMLDLTESLRSQLALLAEDASTIES